MAVFDFTASKLLPEEYEERGTIIADNEAQAIAVLRSDSFITVRLKTITGFPAMLRRFSSSSLRP